MSYLSLYKWMTFYQNWCQYNTIKVIVYEYMHNIFIDLLRNAANCVKKKYRCAPLTNQYPHKSLDCSDLKLITLVVTWLKQCRLFCQARWTEWILFSDSRETIIIISLYLKWRTELLLWSFALCSHGDIMDRLGWFNVIDAWVTRHKTTLSAHNQEYLIMTLNGLLLLLLLPLPLPPPLPDPLQLPSPSPSPSLSLSLYKHYHYHYHCYYYHYHYYYFYYGCYYYHLTEP